ncbi:hypothetical protein LguiA_001283 [Lonicera macranthoides]
MIKKNQVLAKYPATLAAVAQALVTYGVKISGPCGGIGSCGGPGGDGVGGMGRETFGSVGGGIGGSEKSGFWSGWSGGASIVLFSGGTGLKQRQMDVYNKGDHVLIKIVNATWSLWSSDCWLAGASLVAMNATGNAIYDPIDSIVMSNLLGMVGLGFVVPCADLVVLLDSGIEGVMKALGCSGSGKRLGPKPDFPGPPPERPIPPSEPESKPPKPPEPDIAGNSVTT